MGILNNLMGAVFSSWQGLLDSGNIPDTMTAWLKPLMDVLSIVLWVVLALVGSAGSIYAVYVGIKMARADSAEAREENKKRMINIIVTVIVVIVLIIFFNVFLPMIIGAFVDEGGNWKDPSKKESIDTIIKTAKILLRVA